LSVDTKLEISKWYIMGVIEKIIDFACL